MVTDTLTKVFGTPSGKFLAFYSPARVMKRTAYQAATTSVDFEKERASVMAEQVQVLASFVELLTEQVELESPHQSAIQSTMEPTKDIFISHSSRDREIAEALVELLRAALSLPSDRIRCTSVNGYKLPLGASTEEQLRQEVGIARVLVGLITPASIRSAYVSFELGARWGARMPIFPLLAAGADSSFLKGPLSGFNALNLANRADIHQMIEDIAGKLGMSVVNLSSFQKHIEKLVETSSKLPEAAETPKQNHLESRPQGVEYFIALFDAVPRDAVRDAWDVFQRAVKRALQARRVEYAEDFGENLGNLVGLGIIETAIISHPVKEFWILAERASAEPGFTVPKAEFDSKCRAIITLAESVEHDTSKLENIRRELSLKGG